MRLDRYFLIIGFLIIVTITAGCSGNQHNNDEQKTDENVSRDVGEMKTALFIIAPANFKDEEYYTPKKILEDAGVKVATASSVKEAKSVNGKTQKIDILLDNATADYDAVVFIGGPGASVYFENAKAHKLAKQAFDDGRVVAAICIAPNILARAGVLNLKKATVWNGDGMQSALIEKEGAIYVEEPVVVDGSIVTADGPAAARQFGETILELLS